MQWTASDAVISSSVYVVHCDWQWIIFHFVFCARHGLGIHLQNLDRDSLIKCSVQCVLVIYIFSFLHFVWTLGGHCQRTHQWWQTATFILHAIFVVIVVVVSTLTKGSAFVMVSSSIGVWFFSYCIFFFFWLSLLLLLFSIFQNVCRDQLLRQSDIWMRRYANVGIQHALVEHTPAVSRLLSIGGRRNDRMNPAGCCWPLLALMGQLHCFVLPMMNVLVVWRHAIVCSWVVTPLGRSTTSTPY